jgi:hypothetical protein
VASTKPAPEKFPKKLQAFPFVPGATTGELTKAHKFFFSPAEFVKSATNLSMIPDNTMIPEVNITYYIGARIQVEFLSTKDTMSDCGATHSLF